MMSVFFLPADLTKFASMITIGKNAVDLCVLRSV